jgi:hypothetical protein
MKRAPTLSTLALAALVSTCGGSDDPTGPGDGGGPAGTTRTIKADPSLANDIQGVFNRHLCSSGNCHGSQQQAALDLRAGNAHASLVNVPSTNEPGMVRVIPGDADRSYLVVKLEGRQTVGVRMPLGRSPLDSIDLTNVKNWINRGARNN